MTSSLKRPISASDPELDEAVRWQRAGVLELDPAGLLDADLVDHPIELLEAAALDQEGGVDGHPLMHRLTDPDVDGEAREPVDDLRPRGRPLLFERRGDQFS